MTQRAAGWMLLAGAVFLLLVNISDAITDLQDFHGAATPAFIGMLLKQIGMVGLAALGGKILPTHEPPP